MKFVKRITVFFIIPMTMYAGGFVSSIAISEFFYPGRTTVESHPVIEEPPVTESMEEAVLEVAVSNEPVINADTAFIIQEYNGNDGEMTEESVSIPETYLGMNRELFIQAIGEYSQLPALTDLEKGFTGCEVVSFSPQKVIIRKTYILEEMPEGFFLVNENNYVTVYYTDIQTVYMNTNIPLSALPKELQEEILYIKYIEKEEELYDFLEAYSS